MYPVADYMYVLPVAREAMFLKAATSCLGAAAAGAAAAAEAALASAVTHASTAVAAASGTRWSTRGIRRRCNKQARGGLEKVWEQVNRLHMIGIYSRA